MNFFFHSAWTHTKISKTNNGYVGQEMTPITESNQLVTRSVKALVNKSGEGLNELADQLVTEQVCSKWTNGKNLKQIISE